MFAFALLLAAQTSTAPATPPRPIDPGSWVSEDDYPAEALSGQVEGRTEFRLSIDARGRVTACDILNSANAALDAATCRLMVQRARFEPARDAAGAVASTHTSSIDWRLPEVRPVPFAPAQVVVELRTPRRAAAFCRLTRHGQLPEAVAAPGCPPNATATEPPSQAHFLEYVVANLLPEGQRPPFRAAMPGRPSSRIRVRFEVDARGAVVSCQPLGSHRSNSPEAAQERDRCTELGARGMPIFEPAAPGSAPRRAVLEIVQTLEAF